MSECKQKFNQLVKELSTLIEEEFEAYVDACDLDEDRSIDIQHFAEYVKETIESNYGKAKFSEFDIERYAADYADSNVDALFERQVNDGDSVYEEYRESQWI